MKNNHIVRDPIHKFVSYTNEEKVVIDSPQFQRLRDIHQLAMTYLIYPGASHKRFEHSLGVMELATNIFDVVMDDDNLTRRSREVFKEQLCDKQYWRQTLRMAALCHDVGHLPFSHTGEKILEGINHEDLTRGLIKGDMKQYFNQIPVNAPDGGKTLDPKIISIIATDDFEKTTEQNPEELWKKILSSIITSDLFGADRMDYLLRDSCHIGVPYGLVDKDRLVRSLRILDIPFNEGIPLGIHEKDLPLVESLLMSRHWMYSQVYQHPTRKIYDEHLQDFLKELMQEESFKVNEDKPEGYLRCTDSDILRELFVIKKHPEHRLHNHSNKLLERKYRFRLVYKQNIDDKDLFKKHFPQTENKNPFPLKLKKSYAPASTSTDPTYSEVSNELPEESTSCAIPQNPTDLICSKISNEFFEDIIKNIGKSTDKDENLDFPVKLEDGTIKEARYCSKIFNHIISTDFDYGYIFAKPDKSDDIKKWIKDNKDKILLNRM